MMDASTLVELIGYRQKNNANERAVIFPDATISYGELGDRVDAIASGLLALGTQPGDRVGYFLSDGPECLPLLFGIIRSGAIAVPLNNRFKAYELSKVVTQCGMNILFTSPQTSALGADYIGLIREAQEQKRDVKFTVDAYPDEEFIGKVEQIRLSSTQIQNVVTYPVVVAAPNPDLKLLPGMTAWRLPGPRR